jgi:hypothetical protein
LIFAMDSLILWKNNENPEKKKQNFD